MTGLHRIVENKKNDLKKPIIIAGPCSVENYEILDNTAKFLKGLGIEYLRGGIFKPRTSPYSFQGLGADGIGILKEVKRKYSMKIVSEILDVRDIEEMTDIVDVIQVGSRNMFNYSLLKELGRTNKCILLKRGMSATIKEWLNAAEYIALEGKSRVILCERGIRTFETYTRNTLDVSCIPVIKQETGLEIIADPSHGTGKRELIESMCLASIAAGADGIMVEVHPDPDNAISDGFQSVNFNQFEKIYKSVIKLYSFMKELS